MSVREWKSFHFNSIQQGGAKTRMDAYPRGDVDFMKGNGAEGRSRIYGMIQELRRRGNGFEGVGFMGLCV